jgi:hypothetical protein
MSETMATDLFSPARGAARTVGCSIAPRSTVRDTAGEIPREAVGRSGGTAVRRAPGLV